MYKFMENENGKPLENVEQELPTVGESLISMRDIWKTYQMGTEELHALRGVSFDVKKGEYLAIIGPSGSGKSTLMNLIGCLDSPSKGEYWINGHQVAEMTDDELAKIRNKEIGFVFQTFIYAGMRAGERHDKAQAALAAVELGDRVLHKPNELSGGQRQRVAIARALVNHPSILLADEPTGALDTKTSHEIMALFEKLHEEGNTIILVTHEPDIAERAHRVITIRDGVIEKDERHK